METQGRGRRKELVGEVISNKMMKTIIVQTKQMVKHKKYGKYVIQTSVFRAHDEKSEAKIGDRVRIHETRPLSKSKRWMLSEVIEATKEA